MKKKEGKPKVSLVYPSIIREVARVREYGANKHGSTEDWKTTQTIDHVDACLRHVYAIVEGEWNDQESGLSHAGHAVANLMFIFEERRIKDAL